VALRGTRAELEWRAGDVLGWAASGELKLRTEHMYPLAEAAQAQSDLEGAEDDGEDSAGAVKTGRE
jgi:NADPH2:quinone reductase